MATLAHCLYCFEALSASLEKRECLDLARVQDLWAEFSESKQREEKPESEPMNRDEDEAEEEEEEEEDGKLEQSDSDDNDNDDDDQPVQQPVPRSELHLPSISRLQNLTPSTGSSSSTPSSLSATSSRAALYDNSKSSSISSFFSFSRRSPASASASASASSSSSPPTTQKEHPLFVTWNTVSSRGHKSLRGCIGTFEPQDLSHGLKSYALTAAFDDTRFPPITSPDLPSLSTSVTLLTAFTPTTPLNWTIGLHGLRISFSHRGKRLSATYLPDVAADQGWSKEETLVSLMRKAGWAGQAAEWQKVGDLKVVRYRGRKESLGWGEWRAWRVWVDGREGVGGKDGGKGK